MIQHTHATIVVAGNYVIDGPNEYLMIIVFSSIFPKKNSISDYYLLHNYIIL